MSKIEKRTKLFTNLLYVTLGVAGFGLLLLLIGLIARSIIAILLSILFIIGGGALSIFVLYWLVDYKRTFRLYSSVVERKKKTIEQISKDCDMAKLDVRQQVDRLIREGDLEGYVRIGEAVVLQEEYEANLNDAEKRGVAVKCSSCGASFLQEKESDACPYCGNYVVAK